MDIVIKQAERFVRNHLSGGIRKYEEILNDARSKIATFYTKLDKIKFLSLVLEANNSQYQNHLLKCIDPENCDENFQYESLSYYLNQDLRELGVQVSHDAFTSEEKNETEVKLNEVLSQLETLRNGQQVIYEGLQEEIEELRALYFLGKKNWYQLLIGKSTEMVSAGIISETVSKQIVDSVKPFFTNLLAAASIS